MALKINIFTPGAHDKSYLPLINEYQKRINRFGELSWHFVKGHDKDSENSNLLKALGPSRYIVLDENGSSVSTMEMAKTFSRAMESGAPVINIVIGGAYGLSGELINSADEVWAFGKITLPHQLVRLITAEQVYRAMTINANHPYHHK